MRRILSVLLENEPGALSRIVGLFSQRAFNIDSLNVAQTDDATLSRITITTYGDDQVLEQITKQVNKLVDVLRVSDLTDRQHIEREIALVKVLAMNPKTRAEVKRLSEIFRADIIDVGKQIYTVQITGDDDKISSFIEILKNETEIIEVVRSGTVGIARGEKALRGK
ncbi:acetolactate synthase small subunit [Thalassotalea sp. HSM 43]|uniref:acetolactate synthase small subunit n=1 Tax=Thalassotalea sp. HSM 43 TaxID=2552945 RepID=UPI0010814D4B|nr:acetolactate synthase small subunit [Thalassotalea sp. HSM 43]QBY05676.1 acetolactate synthase small subunit [Thalassotalea sp. HSM 43]